MDIHLENIHRSIIHPFITDISHASCLSDPVIIERTKITRYNLGFPIWATRVLGRGETEILEWLVQHSG